MKGWSLESSGMCRVVSLKWTDISEVHTASIIRAIIIASGKHTNHYTTNATFLISYKVWYALLLL
jgi:hypothetical protein